jgi:hypothetical protein
MVSLILKKLPGDDLIRTLRINKEWRRLGCAAQIDHIRTLCSDENFPLFFPPPPPLKCDTAPSEIAAYMKDSIYETVGYLSGYLPDNLSDPRPDEVTDAQPMSVESVDSQLSYQTDVISAKSKSIFEIIDDPNELTNLLNSCHQYSLLQLFSNGRNEAPKLSGKLCERIQTIEEHARESTLEHINGSYSNLLCIPKELLASTSIQDLDFFKAKLTWIPSAINQLASLKVLNLEENHLLNLPPELAELNQLHALNLASNDLTQIPALPPNLQILNLSNNPFRQFPFMGTLLKLKKLSLCHTTLTTYPQEIATLPNLIELCIANNPIYQFRVGENDLPNLARVIVKNVPYDHIQPEINRLSSIKSLQKNGVIKDGLNRRILHQKKMECSILRKQLHNFVQPTPQPCCFFSSVVNDLSRTEIEQKAPFIKLQTLSLDKWLFDVLPQEIKNRSSLKMEYSF